MEPLKSRSNQKKYIILHHSVSADHPTLSNVGAIRNYHVNVNGWVDVGYHFLLDRINGHLEIVCGRMLDERGAHCKELDFNASGIGICVIGNFDQEPPPLDTLATLRHLCRSLMNQNIITADRVLGHREAQAMGGVPVEQRKSCPGKAWDMGAFRDSL
ncbi:MAG: N-acetylmuramoyl-L-alanine amidase [Elusimicrobia bacterium]|nr:N-acetylmuramoyl-L-alanine amidase [Elusimicrobiota bacterium]